LIRSYLKAESDKDNPFDESGHGSGVASLVSYYTLNLSQMQKTKERFGLLVLEF
jgi:hypothetical protein